VLRASAVELDIMSYPSSWLKMFSGHARSVAALMPSSSADAAARDAPACCPWTLQFKQASLETSYRQHYSERARMLDQQVRRPVLLQELC
jgi:hypothetical protein